MDSVKEVADTATNGVSFNSGGTGTADNPHVTIDTGPEPRMVFENNGQRFIIGFDGGRISHTLEEEKITIDVLDRKINDMLLMLESVMIEVDKLNKKFDDMEEQKDDNGRSKGVFQGISEKVVPHRTDHAQDGHIEDGCLSGLRETGLFRGIGEAESEDNQSEPAQ